MSHPPRHARFDASSRDNTRELRGLELPLAQLGGVHVIVGRVAGPITGTAIQRAAFRLQRRHPALRGRLVLEPSQNGRPRLEVCEPQVDHVKFSEVRSDEGMARAELALWQCIAEREVNQPLALSEGFPFRVVWIPDLTEGEGGHILVSVPCALADALSLMLLLRDLLAECAKLLLQPGGSRYDTYAVDPLPLGPALLSELPIGLGERIASYRFRRQLLRAHRDFAATSPLPIARTLVERREPVAHCRFHSGDRAQYGKIQAACRDQGTTPVAAFHAATQFATTLAIVRATGRMPSHADRLRLSAIQDVCLRRALGDEPSVSGVGLFQGMSSLDVEVPERIDFWDLARTLERRAAHQLGRRAPLLSHQALDGVGDLERTLERHGIDYAASGGAGSLLKVRVERFPYSSRSGPLELRQLFVLHSAMRGGAMLGVAQHELAGCYYYSSTSVHPACLRETGDRMLPFVVELFENCDRLSGPALSLKSYALEHPSLCSPGGRSEPHVEMRQQARRPEATT